MSGIEIILGIVLLAFCIAIILVVLLQEGQQQQAGTLSGNTDTFFEKNKSRTVDAFLARWTKVISIGFVIAVITINAISYFKK